VALIVAALLATVFGLVPLGAYLTWVAGMHRRPTPTAMSGPADLLALLAGLCGLLPTLGVLTLLTVQSNTRLLARGSFTQCAALWAEERNAWLLTVTLFLAAAAVAFGLALAHRRGTLAVYNIDRLGIERAVTEVMAGLGLTAARFGNVWGDGREILAIDPAPGMHFAAVRWRTSDPRLREELDRGLRLRLDRTPGAGNLGVAAALTTAGVGCLGAAFAAAALLVYFLYLTRLA
jgi:hypothetical protein